MLAVQGSMLSCSKVGANIQGWSIFPWERPWFEVYREVKHIEPCKGPLSMRLGNDMIPRLALRGQGKTAKLSLAMPTRSHRELQMGVSIFRGPPLPGMVVPEATEKGTRKRHTHIVLIRAMLQLGASGGVALPVCLLRRKSLSPSSCQLLATGRMTNWQGFHQRVKPSGL